MSASIPAIVVGAGVNGLGVARSLTRAGVAVWMLGSDASVPAMHTNAATPLTIGSLHGQAMVEELVGLGIKRFAGLRPVLLLTQEESVRAVSQSRKQLVNLYRFTLPSAEVVATLQHKYGFQRLAEQSGAPIPQLIRVNGAKDLPLLDTLRYPVAVKPGQRHAGYSRQFKKAYRMNSATQAAELLSHILTVLPDVVVQEWIPGPDANIYFCLQAIDATGQPVASFTGRKIRSWPPQIGGTASCVPAPEAHDELTALTTRFFRHAGVIGVASMEYKRDVTTGKFWMVEPTIGRTDYQEEIATLNGVNLPYAAYCAELGRPFPTAAGTTRPMAWRVRSEDVQSAALQQQRAGDGFDAVSRVIDALWRWRDPLPFCTRELRRAHRALQKRTSKSAPKPRIAGGKP